MPRESLRESIRTNGLVYRETHRDGFVIGLKNRASDGIYGIYASLVQQASGHQVILQSGRLDRRTHSTPRPATAQEIMAFIPAIALYGVLENPDRSETARKSLSCLAKLACQGIALEEVAMVNNAALDALNGMSLDDQKLELAHRGATHTNSE